MSTGEIVTAIVVGLVAIGGVAMILDARRKRRKAAVEQRHSNVKPLETHDEATRLVASSKGQDSY